MNSVKIQPFDLEQLAGAGTQDSTEGHVATIVRPSAPGYWKITAVYSCQAELGVMRKISRFIFFRSSRRIAASAEPCR